LIIEILSVEILAIVAKSKGTVMARAIRKSGVRMIPLSGMLGGFLHHLVLGRAGRDEVASLHQVAAM
jgi:hypothetical protein